MRIKLSPCRMDGSLSLMRLADKVLKINNDTLDLSGIPAGATIDAAGLHPMILGNIEMAQSGPEITIVLPIGANASEEQRFPADIVDPPMGTIALPQPDPEEA